MAKSSLLQRLAQQGRVQTIQRVANGSPELIVLKPQHNSPDVIAATLAMVKRGAPMLHAKRAAEQALTEGRAITHLPVVEDRMALADDLEAAGMTVTFSSVSHGLHNP